MAHRSITLAGKNYTNNGKQGDESWYSCYLDSDPWARGGKLYSNSRENFGVGKRSFIKLALGREVYIISRVVLGGQERFR